MINVQGIRELVVLNVLKDNVRRKTDVNVYLSIKANPDLDRLLGMTEEQVSAMLWDMANREDNIIYGNMTHGYSFIEDARSNLVSLGDDLLYHKVGIT